MRYNIFNRAHLPLKTALISGCVSLTDALNGALTTTESVKPVEEVLRVYKEQISYERLHILPFIFEYEPAISISYSTEHDKASRLSDRMNGLVQSYRKEENKNEKSKILALISECYNDFMLFNFNHMDDEEAVLNEILWRYYQDKVLMQIEEKMDILPHLVEQGQQRTRLQFAKAA